MKAITLCGAAGALGFALLAAEAVAGAQATFHVRNDSGVTLSCVTWPAGSARRANLTLTPGEEWTIEAKAKPRFLACSPSSRQLQLKLEPGMRYRLVRNRTSGNILLLPAA